MKLPVIFYIYYLIEIVAAIVGGFRYRNLTRPLRILEWLIIISIFGDGVQLALARLGIHNLWMSHFYTLIEIVFVFLMYLSWIKKYQSRLMLTFCLSAFIVFWIVSKFTFEPLSFLDVWTGTIAMILQITFSVLILIDYVKESDINWTKDSRLWIATGIIVYSAGCLIRFTLFSSILQLSKDNIYIVCSIIWILIILSNLLYVRGFLCKK